MILAFAYQAIEIVLVNDGIETLAIARAGHVIVSGLARGIDARAHQAAIEIGTIAVLAGGLGNIYPADHEALLERLLGKGAAISEMPFGWEARGGGFSRRHPSCAGPWPAGV